MRHAPDIQLIAAIDDTIRRMRLDTAGAANRFRVLWASLWLVRNGILLAAGGADPMLRRQTLFVAAIAAGAAVAAWVGHRNPRARLWSRYLLLVDLVVFFLIQLDSVVSSPATASTAFAPAAFVAVLLAVTLMHDGPLVWATAGLSVAFTAVLGWVARLDATTVSTSIIVVSIASLIARAGERQIRSMAARVGRGHEARTRLARYFSPQVAERIALGTNFGHEGETREVTVLMADLRGFTTWSEKLESPDVVAQLNEYLSRMVEVIHQHGGILDKFIGDGILAWFSAEHAGPNHAAIAVACARSMSDSLGALNLARANRELPPFDMGIALHTGDVTIGDIGSPNRREFTIIGDTVNTVARVEGFTKTFGVRILATSATRVRAGDGYPWIATVPLELRGKSAFIEAFSLTS